MKLEGLENNRNKKEVRNYTSEKLQVKSYLLTPEPPDFNS